MQAPDKIRVLFIAGFGPIVRDVDAGQKLYAKGLQISFKEESGGYLHTDALQGARHLPFGHSLKPRILVLVTVSGRIICPRLTLGLSSTWIVSKEPQRSLNPWGIEC